eukprot:3227643-Pleurochrysis_carterae.AAC.1
MQEATAMLTFDKIEEELQKKQELFVQLQFQFKQHCVNVIGRYNEMSENFPKDIVKSEALLNYTSPNSSTNEALFSLMYEFLDSVQTTCSKLLNEIHGSSTGKIMQGATAILTLKSIIQEQQLYHTLHGAFKSHTRDIVSTYTQLHNMAPGEFPKSAELIKYDKSNEATTVFNKQTYDELFKMMKDFFDNLRERYVFLRTDITNIIQRCRKYETDRLAKLSRKQVADRPTFDSMTHDLGVHVGTIVGEYFKARHLLDRALVSQDRTSNNSLNATQIADASVSAKRRLL